MIKQTNNIMKYFGIRLSLVINFIMVCMFLCIDVDKTPFKNWLIYVGIVGVFTFINYFILNKVYTASDRNEIFLISNDK